MHLKIIIRRGVNRVVTKDKIYVEGYEVSQYEDIDTRNTRGDGIDARYIIQENPEYKDNVLIEAIPPRLTMKQLYKHFYRAPAYSEADRFKSNEYREDRIMGLLRYINPRGYMIDIAKGMDTLIKRGYVSKRIDDSRYREGLNISGSALRGKAKKQMDLHLRNAVVSSPIDGVGPLSMTVIGASGNGKTTAVNRLLAMYPQVIKHTTGIGNYKEFTQIVWLKIECTTNRSIKSMVIQFLEAIDDVVGTTFAIEHQKDNKEQLRSLMKHLVRYFGIGVLCIDEMQHIGNWADSETMFNELVAIANEVQLPIVYIGTYQLRNTVFNKQFRHAKRVEGIKTVDVGLLIDKQFRDFLSELWKYQWTKKESILTEEIIKLMYESTVGIVDYIVKVFCMAQIKAIETGREEITPKIIKSVVKNNLKMTEEQRIAYKSNDINKISKCEDLIPVNIELFTKDRIARAEAAEQFRQLRQQNEMLTYIEKEEAIMDIVTHFMQEEFDELVITGKAKEVIKKHGLLDRPSLLSKVGRLLREDN